ncbi:MAG: hypothetical protein CVV49_00150 [Spirochaetae bacterium HGW-Spirochaetae-5]|nr:MAG: hypothetical protein CVV49_00150 [Spirochaetae bacterium HGW-Spirochaetae-5]
MSNLIVTENGVFNPAKIIFMSAITDKKDNTGSFFTIQLEGIVQQVFISGTREECKIKWTDIVSKLPK